MTTLRRIILTLLVIAVLGLFCWGLALYIDWPLWMALALFLGIIGAYLLLRFLHRLYIVVRVRSTLTLQSAAQKREERLASPETNVRGKWRSAVATLRNSGLRRYGNPLYVLPWYLIIGKAGTGKTTALARARLSSPIQRVRQGERPAQTVNYDWWFFDEAVVLDCAGRYVAADDSEQDRKEWNIGLDLLAKYRSREGVNGLVLAVSADRLISPDLDLLAEEGRVIRQRIDQLIRLFGKRFPIYILVTKCDLIYGFEGWTTALPRDDLKQALGYLDDASPLDASAADQPDPAAHQTSFIARAMGVIGGRLRALRNTLGARSANFGPDLLLFPNELAALEGGLEAFTRACLGAHPYLEAPLLRGLFFSSGQQQGGAVSRLADELLPTSPAHGTTNAGLFLHEFFGRILPGDRHVGQPAQSKNPWIKVTENIGLTAWLLLTSALAIALTVGFVHDMKTLDEIETNYPFGATLGGKLEDDEITLQKAMNTLVLVERRNQSRFNSMMADTDDMQVMERRLRGKYIADFRANILTQADAYLGASLLALSQSDPEKMFAATIRNHVRYINLIKARQQGAGYDALAALPQRQLVGSYLSAASFARLHSLFLADLAWTPSDDPYLASALRKHQALLDQYAYNDPPFGWLMGLLEHDEQLKPVAVTDFWRIAAIRPGQQQMVRPAVPGAFTRAGQEEIERFFAEMQTSVDDLPTFAAKRSAFERSYREQRQKAWQHFVEAFPDGDRSVIGEAAWRAELSDMTSATGPYFRLINRLAEEFSDEFDDALPGWLLFSRQFAQIFHQAKVLPGDAKSKQVIATINAVGGKALKETAKGEPKAGERIIATHLAATDALKKYLDTLGALSNDAAQGSGKAYQLAADFHSYGIDAATKSSALIDAFDQQSALKKLIGSKEADDEAVWRLIGGPLRFITQYIDEQASCTAQADWEAKVLFPLQAQNNMKTLMDELYGQKGSVWAFADGVAKPFLQRNSNNYQLTQTAGFSLPFTPAFLPALNSASSKRQERVRNGEQMEREAQQQQLKAQKDDLDSKQKLADTDRAIADNKQKIDANKAQTVKLTITAHPTSLNAGALAKPYATTLSVQCASGPHKISNFNFLVSDTVLWAPGQCGDVELQIKIGDLVLGKKYPGSGGLYAFLVDFRDGTRQFFADEFPAMKGKLEQLGIRQIGVKYVFDGADALIAAAQQRENLLRIDREKNAEKQRLQDEAVQRSKQVLTAKLDGPGEPAMQVRLPIRVGMCWAADEAQQKQALDLGEPPPPSPAPAPAPEAAPAGAAPPETGAQASAPPAARPAAHKNKK